MAGGVGEYTGIGRRKRGRGKIMIYTYPIFTFFLSSSRFWILSNMGVKVVGHTIP